MKRFFLTCSLCASVASAQATPAKPALFLTRVGVLPEKAATFGSIQILFGITTFIPAAIMAVVVKRHTAASNEPTMKGVIAAAPWSVAFASAAGTMLGGISAFLIGQGFSSFADAAASKIWNPDAVVVKTPIAVQP